MWLFDGNLLVALTIDTHEFHQRAQRWFASQVEPFATCAITEGTLLRVHMRTAQDTSAAAAWSALEAIHALPDHIFWDDGFSYSDVAFATISGSKQVTDAWLAELARRHGAQLATLDAGLAAFHSDVAILIPT
ncbi:MAG TPA: TA system VapC family ribonuclease toxin [Pyrinomonadaceae bacterium]|nr:TA system VapC family ribonuclease toxin [Pyrinomonadaceae bacterium]